MILDLNPNLPHHLLIQLPHQLPLLAWLLSLPMMLSILLFFKMLLFTTQHFKMSTNMLAQVLCMCTLLINVCHTPSPWLTWRYDADVGAPGRAQTLLAIVMQSLYAPSLQIDHGDCGLFCLVLDMHIYICESMFVLRSLLLLLVVVVDSLIAWLINCQIVWLVDWPNCRFTMVLVVYMYNYGSMIVFILLMLLLLLDCLVVWLIDCLFAWLIDYPISKLTMVMVVYLGWYWTYICTTVKACLFWTYYCCCCCCCLIAWLLDWLTARLPDWLITLPPNWPLVMVGYFDWYWTYICIAMKTCLLWAYCSCYWCSLIAWLLC